MLFFLNISLVVYHIENPIEVFHSLIVDACVGNILKSTQRRNGPDCELKPMTFTISWDHNHLIAILVYFLDVFHSKSFLNAFLFFNREVNTHNN